MLTKGIFSTISIHTYIGTKCRKHADWTSLLAISLQNMLQINCTNSLVTHNQNHFYDHDTFPETILKPSRTMDYEFKKRSAQAREKVENLFEFEGCKVRITLGLYKCMANPGIEKGLLYLNPCITSSIASRLAGGPMAMSIRLSGKMGEC